MVEEDEYREAHQVFDNEGKKIKVGKFNDAYKKKMTRVHSKKMNTLKKDEDRIKAITNNFQPVMVSKYKGLSQMKLEERVGDELQKRKINLEHIKLE